MLCFLLFAAHLFLYEVQIRFYGGIFEVRVVITFTFAFTVDLDIQEFAFVRRLLRAFGHFNRTLNHLLVVVEGVFLFLHYAFLLLLLLDFALVDL